MWLKQTRLGETRCCVVDCSRLWRLRLERVAQKWAVAKQPGCLFTHLPRSVPAGVSTAAQAPILPVGNPSGLACQLHGDDPWLQRLLGPLALLQGDPLRAHGCRQPAAPWPPGTPGCRCPGAGAASAGSL